MKSLLDWKHFLQDQAEALFERQSALAKEDQIPERTRVPNPEEWLIADAFLCSAGIETAAREFIRTGAWPVLDGRNLQHLLHRVLLAFDAVCGLLREMLPIPMPNMPPLPPLDNLSAMMKWMFIDLWNAEGEAHLRRHHRKTRRRSAEETN